MNKFQLLLAVFIVGIAPIADAKKTQSARAEAFSPEEELAGFTVPEGFVVELVASEKDGIINPIDLTFDDAGRLWTQTARMYPLDPSMVIQWDKDGPPVAGLSRGDRHNLNHKRIQDLYRGKARGSDEILILSNLGKQQALQVKKFATGLTIPQSILPYKNGAFVAQGSELFYLEDTDGDGKGDKRILMIEGFGIADSHTMAHSLVRAPGGWVHFAHGALNRGTVKAVGSGASVPMEYSKVARVSLDGQRIELVNSGLNNIWGLQLRSDGEWYHQEANDSGYCVTPAEPGTGFRGIGHQRLRPYQPIRPPLNRYRIGGTGLSGLAFSDDISGGFPSEWENVGFIANTITSAINCVKIVWNSDGTIDTEHLPDFLTSTDDWFRPVNMEFGPDGCLYVADWYNQVISHGEVSLDHPGRDRSHGRIWRIRPKSLVPRTPPNLYTVPTPQLVDHLKSPLLWEKRAAWHQIADRSIDTTKELIPALITLASDPSQHTATRIHALWSLESLAHYHEPLMDSLLLSEDDAIQREALRSLAYFGLDPNRVATKVKGFIDSPNVKLRSQAIRTLDELGTASLKTIDLLVSCCRPSLPGNFLAGSYKEGADEHVFRRFKTLKPLGGPYERDFERFLARRALEKYPIELLTYLKSDLRAKQPATNLVWAMQALPGEEAATGFINVWDQVKDRKLDLAHLIIIANLAKYEQVYATVTPQFRNSANADHIVDLALGKVEDTYTPAMAELLKAPIEQVLSSKDSARQKVALRAVRAFSPSVAPNLIAPFLDGPHVAEALDALAQQAGANKLTFTKILDDPKTDAQIWLAALSALSRHDPDLTKSYAITRLEGAAEGKPTIIHTLGKTTHGTVVLLLLLSEDVISPSDISFEIADRIRTLHPKNPAAVAVFESAEQKRQAAKKAAIGRLPALIRLAEKSGGTPAIGKALFTGMCLSCHVVGAEGRGIAPALDGSANRTPEGLLTSVLDPDAAVEGAYALYRVITKEGEIIEGYQVRNDARGTLIATLTGQVFVPAKHTASAGYTAGGRSFMPDGLFSELPESVIEDFLAYLRTLN